MDNNEFSKVGLYEHNARTYRKIKDAYESGENIVGIVHATGTGKTYNALQLAYDNRDKKIIYVVPNNSIIEHIESIIANNPNLDRERDFPNLEFRTYQSFVNMSKDEIKNLDLDLLILDEFHHLGAPVWGSRIMEIINTHENLKVFGMTAYTVRDRGTPYERDMVNPDTDELFSLKIVSRYDLVDAMLDGVLPKDVIYRTSYTNLIGLEKKLEDKVRTMKATKRELEEYKRVLDVVKKRVAEAPGVAELIRKYVKPNGKYFYFCPPKSEEGTNDINSIMKEAYDWFKDYVSEEDIVFYVTTSDMGEEGKYNREMFYKDLTLDGKPADGKLRIMFAINQYNEGVHAPNVDGIIMGRGTTSDIVFFELLGRALSVRGNVYEKYKEYESYSYDRLVSIAKDKDIIVTDEMTSLDIIEKLIAPVVIDLTNNIEFIKELEDNLKGRIKERREKGTGIKNNLKLEDVSFDIDVLNEDLYKVLSNLRSRIYKDWDSIYELAKKYYEHHGNLRVIRHFKTLNGYLQEENGVSLGGWINTQRHFYKKGKLSQEKIDKLNKIGMVYTVYSNAWDKMYELAKKYYLQHGNLDISKDFKVEDENGEVVRLGKWVLGQRKNFGLSHSKRNKLEQIGIKVDNNTENLSKEEIREDYEWRRMYKLAVAYYEFYNNLNIPLDFKTWDGYSYDRNGVSLGVWFDNEKKKMIQGTQSDDKISRWNNLAFSITAFLGSFDEMYVLAKRYFSVYRHLDIPLDFRTNDGINYDEYGFFLGAWLRIQLSVYKQNRLSEDKKSKLESIGMMFDKSLECWEAMYEKAMEYYQKYGNLSISAVYKCADGSNLGAWLYYQKYLIGLNKLEEDKFNKLKEIGVNSGIRSGMDETDFDMMYDLAKKHYNEYGNLFDIKYEQYTTMDGITSSLDGYNLGLWILTQERLMRQNKLPLEKVNKLKEIGISVLNKEASDMIRALKDTVYNDFEMMYEIAKMYYQKRGNLDVPLDFVTSNGYEYDILGFELGNWIAEQIIESKKLSDDKIIKLKEIGMNFDVENALWERMYKYAKICYDHYGNLDVNESFKTSNGYEYDERGVSLGTWVKEQTSLLLDNKLSDSRKEKLELLGIKIEDIYDSYFEQMYKKAKLFYNEHGHMDPLYKFKHDSSIPMTKDEHELFFWVASCNRAHARGKLDEKTYELLKDIGMFLTSRESNWNNMYCLASKYFKHYGNLNVSEGFKTFDGYTYDAKGFDLSKWISSQKLKLKNGKMSEDKKNKLNEIGIVWNIRTSVQETKDICLQYGIDYKFNINVLKHISNIELVSKINFLLDNGESIVDGKRLHGIFSMSSMVMHNIYRLTLEELINKYYIRDSKRRN